MEKQKLILPWFDEILEGRRFREDANIPNALDREITGIADRTASRFVVTLEQSDSVVPTRPEEREALARWINDGFITDICDIKTPWFPCPDADDVQKKEYQNRYSMILETLLPPVRLPYDEMTTRAISSGRTAIVAAIGAFLGAIFFAWLFPLLKESASSGLLVGGAVGSAVLVGCSFLLGYHAKLRSRFLWAIGGITLADIAVTLVATLHPALALSFGTTILQSFTLRVLCYALVALILLLSRRSKRFDRNTARHLVETLYLNRAEAAVMFLSLLDLRNTNEDHQGILLDMQSRMSELVERCERREKGMNSLARNIENMWNADLRRLPVLIAESVRLLSNQNYKLACADSPFFAAQIPADLPGEPMAHIPMKTLVWQESLALRYEPVEFVSEGDEVVIEREPVERDGQIVMIGMVTKKRKETS